MAAEARWKEARSGGQSVAARPDAARAKELHRAKGPVGGARAGCAAGAISATIGGFDLPAPASPEGARLHSSVAQWQSIRLLTGGLLVRVQPEEPSLYSENLAVSGNRLDAAAATAGAKKAISGLSAASRRLLLMQLPGSTDCGGN